MANMTAHFLAVCSWSALFAQAYMSQYLDKVIYLFLLRLFPRSYIERIFRNFHADATKCPRGVAIYKRGHNVNKNV